MVLCEEFDQLEADNYDHHQNQHQADCDQSGSAISRLLHDHPQLFLCGP